MSLPVDDTIEMTQLYARYNTAIDTGDAVAFADCFVAQGVLDSGMAIIEGHDALSDFARQTHSAIPGMRHNATNIVIDGDGQRATGSAFLVGYLVDPSYKVIVTGRYTDTLEKSESGWRFSKRIFAMDKPTST